MVKKAVFEDLEQIMVILNDAKAYLKEKGIPQWQNGYPNRDVFLDDLKKGDLYVLKEDDVVLGMCVIKDFEETYEVIDGAWLNDEPYYVIHRIAIKEDLKGKNCAKQLFDYAKSLGKDVRIDTHAMNESMKRCILKNDFIYCGIITLKDGTLRNAYQWRK